MVKHCQVPEEASKGIALILYFSLQNLTILDHAIPLDSSFVIFHSSGSFLASDPRIPPEKMASASWFSPHGIAK
ncbi:hypothetical protein V6N11_057282 [Hibiscus sabdariffa]|uniref:Uncharacterized protein n=1 Tax=Hibiscus sabdariffa TaxID=183260 RepID=A0ABR2NKT7_9ROSI